MFEWSTSEKAVTDNLREHEEKVFLPIIRVWCAIPKINHEPVEKTIAEIVKETENWGKDHWSLLAYFETRCVDHKGKPDFAHMRINSKKRPISNGTIKDTMFERSWEKTYGTKLKDGKIPNTDHDDYDVMEELEKIGFINNVGTGLHPIIKLTKLGKKVATLIREHKMKENANFNDFALEKHLKVA